MTQKRSPLLFRSPLMLARIERIRNLCAEPKSMAEIASALGISTANASTLIKHLAPQMHIARYERNAGSPTPFYQWGAGKNVPLPAANALDAEENRP